MWLKIPVIQWNNMVISCWSSCWKVVTMQSTIVRKSWHTIIVMRVCSWNIDFTRSKNGLITHIINLQVEKESFYYKRVLKFQKSNINLLLAHISSLQLTFNNLWSIFDNLAALFLKPQMNMRHDCWFNWFSWRGEKSPNIYFHQI